MGKSINRCLSQKNGGEAVFGSASTPIGSMSLQPAIPWKVALLQSLPPLHQPASFSSSRLKTVNRHHQKGGGFFVQQNADYSVSIDT
jgi:hypothetical protein